MSEKQQEPKRGFLSKSEKVLIFGGLILAAFVILKATGGKVFEKSETVTIIERPGATGKARGERVYVADEMDAEVERYLEELASQFSEGRDVETVYRQPEVEEIEIAANITADEKEFIKKQESNFSNKINDAKGWLNMLTTSHKTYSKVKSLFQSSGAANNNGVTKLQDESTAETVYAKLKNNFNISESEAKAFAQTGTKAISDWAEFVMRKD